MTEPNGDGPRPGVFARLAHEAEVREARRIPHRAVRWVGWLICLALVGGVLAGALRASPW